MFTLRLNSQKGKREAFRLGEFLHRRYQKLLGDKYSPKKIYVQSTNFDRTLATAQLVSHIRSKVYLAYLFYTKFDRF